MDDEPLLPEGELTPRAPERADLIALCRELNRLDARYIVVGGFAIILAGYPRSTGDVDILLEMSPENEASVFQALELLPDQAVKELVPGEVGRYTVVRVADEIIVDLMASASGIDYAQAQDHIVIRELDGVPIPFASPELLWRMKCRTHRAKDEADLAFLRHWFAANGRTPPED